MQTQRLFFSLFVIMFIGVGMLTISHAAMPDKAIEEAYTNADYTTAAKLLEQRIEQFTEKISKGEKINFSELYIQYSLLAHIYAWKLNKTDEALKVYQKVVDLKRSEAGVKLPPTEFLFMAEIYERKNETVKAREYYQNLLKELIAVMEKESDDVSIILGEELTKFTKYQIDSINLKAGTKNFKPLLPTLKLTANTSMSPMYQFMPLIFGPAIMYEIANMEKHGGISKTDLAAYIRQNPTNISSMSLNYMLILNASASSVTESSEIAMQAFVEKYPEGYYTLLLRQMFYKFYKDNGQDEKAKLLLTEIKKIAEKRKMELITQPDKRFATPEATWKTYKNALMQGNLDEVMGCYASGRQRHKQVYNALGKEKMKEIGKEMGDIRKVSGNERMAIYEILRKENGKKYSYEIRFHNIDGEWKMQEF